MTLLPIPVLLLCCSTLSSAFQVESYSQDPDTTDLNMGEPLTLICRSDTDWERCSFIHKSSGGHSDSHCSLEWKYNLGDVILTDCPIRERIIMAGDYNQRECGIQISSVKQEDAGTWECEMEEYRFGDFHYGSRHSFEFNPITVTMTTPAPSTTTTSTTTTTTTTTVLITDHEEIYDEEEQFGESQGEELKENEEPEHENDYSVSNITNSDDEEDDTKIVDVVKSSTEHNIT